MCLCVLKHTPHFPVASTFHSSSEGDDGPLDTRQVQRRFIMEACHGEIIISGHNYRYNILKLYIKWWIMFWTWSLHDHVLFFFRCSAPTANTRWTESIRNFYTDILFLSIYTLSIFNHPEPSLTLWAFQFSLRWAVPLQVLGHSQLLHLLDWTHILCCCRWFSWQNMEVNGLVSPQTQDRH